jgi:hypothetical protein
MQAKERIAEPLQNATEHSQRPATGYERWTADRLIQRIFGHAHTVVGDFQLLAELKYRLRHEEVM